MIWFILHEYEVSFCSQDIAETRHQAQHGNLIDSFDSALRREKQLKEWKRAWKLELIEKANPLWKDLFEEVVYGV